MTSKQMALGFTAGLALFLAALGALGQAAPGARAQTEKLDKLRNTTPEQRAKIQDALMTQKLGLTDEQKPKVAALNLEYAKKIQPLIESGRPLAQLREMRELNQEKEAALQKVLTPEQFKKYLAAKEEMRKKIEQRAVEKAARQP
jgi:hypothetical protein